MRALHPSASLPVRYGLDLSPVYCAPSQQPYYARQLDVDAEVRSLRQQVEWLSNKEDFLELENKRRQYAVNFTVACWRQKLHTSRFVRWKLITQAKIQHRNTIGSIASQGKSRSMVPKCFRRWKDDAFRQKVVRKQMEINQLKVNAPVMDLTNSDDASKELLGELKAARVQILELNAEKVQLAKMLLGLKSTVADASSASEAAVTFANWMKMTDGMNITNELGGEHSRLADLARSTERTAKEALALKLQRVYRGKQSRELSSVKRKEVKAANMIQRLHRGKQDRKAFMKAKETITSSSFTSAEFADSRSEEAQNVRVALEVLSTEFDKLKVMARECPDLSCLGVNNLDVQIDLGEVDTMGIQTLTRWVNLHASRGGVKRQLSSWSNDLCDSEILAGVLDNLNAHAGGKSLVVEFTYLNGAMDMSTDAAMVREFASKVGQDIHVSEQELFDRATLVARAISSALAKPQPVEHQTHGQNGIAGRRAKPSGAEDVPRRGRRLDRTLLDVKRARGRGSPTHASAARTGEVSLRPAHITSGSENHLILVVTKLFLSKHGMPQLAVAWGPRLRAVERQLEVMNALWRDARSAGRVARADLEKLVDSTGAAALSLDKLRAGVLNETTRWFNVQRALEQLTIECVARTLGSDNSSPDKNNAGEVPTDENFVESDIVENLDTIANILWNEYDAGRESMTMKQSTGQDQAESKLILILRRHSKALYRAYVQRCETKAEGDEDNQGLPGRATTWDGSSATLSAMPAPDFVDDGAAADVGNSLSLKAFIEFARDCQLPPVRPIEGAGPGGSTAPIAHWSDATAEDAAREMYERADHRRQLNNEAPASLQFEDFVQVTTELCFRSLPESLTAAERVDTFVRQHVRMLVQPSTISLRAPSLRAPVPMLFS